MTNCYLCPANNYRISQEVISVENLKVEFGVTPLFDNVSFVINKKDRIALVGKNGAGKSTMLKILAGLQRPTSGVVAVPREVTIGYLPQVMVLSDECTVMEEAEKAFEHIAEMQAALERMNQELAERTDYESESYHALIERFTRENERFLMMGGTNYQAEIERTLQGLGFSRADFDRPTSEFSGGWRMRIELAKLLLRRPDVLLLDEPTNHLDIASREWIEDALSDYTQALLFVSHDRYFIEKFATRIWLLENGTITDYRGTYEQFREYRARQTALQQTVKAVEREKKPRPKRAPNTARQRERTERDIEKLEAQLAALDAESEANATDYQKLMELDAQKQTLNTQLEALYAAWEALCD